LFVILREHETRFTESADARQLVIKTRTVLIAAEGIDRGACLRTEVQEAGNRQRRVKFGLLPLAFTLTL